MSLPEGFRLGIERLTRAGFDALSLFDAHDFNRTVPRESEFRLPDFGRARPLALVIGNSRELWEPFVGALDLDASLREASNPLDRYSERHVGELQAALEARSKAFFSHGGNPRVPIQRIAQAAGLAELSPSHMSVHPVHGPWIGLRAVLVFDWELPQKDALSRYADLLPDEPRLSYCQGCAAPCKVALEQALTVDRPDVDEEKWRAWLGVRDACPVAPGRRYGAQQIRYHYTKDKAALSPERA